MKLDENKIPTHVGIIIDGNGRWAKRRGLPRPSGHVAGLENLKKRVFDAFDLGVKILSIYAFSTENWNRPQKELDCLFDLFGKMFKEDIDKLNEKGIKVQFMGDYTKFPQKVIDNCENLLEKTKNNDKYILNLGVNYGGKDELVRGINQMIKDGKSEITKEDVDNSLYTANLPPLDFLIRTSGEQRISNFMLWQIAYTEFYFPKVPWPAFTKRHLIKALKVYQKRNRRFGAIKEDDKVENTVSECEASGQGENE